MVLFFVRVLLILLSVNLIKTQTNNVCKTFPDYYLDMQHNKNCYYNPDGNLTVPEIIKRHGYPVETHKVTTKDGYILTVFRIPYGKNTVNETPGPPVFLQHGIALNCACFVARGNKSLGFILADSGYDVWLGNFRGTIYSNTHRLLKNTTAKYWDFTFHEMGVYDLPAQLNLVSSTNKQPITYIGFSMGTTASYIYGTTYPKVAAKKIKIFISLAPIAFMNHLRTPVKYLAPIWPYIAPLLEAINKGHLQIRNLDSRKKMCLPLPFQMKTCEFISYLLFGFSYQQDDPVILPDFNETVPIKQTLPITLLQNVDDTSVKLVSHYVQFISSGTFQQFDYGTAGNLLKYGHAEPPTYNLSRMIVPNYLIRGPNDFLGTKENVDELVAQLPARAKPFDTYVVPENDFNHSDFLVAKDVVTLLYNHVVDFLSTFLGTSS